MTPSTDGRPQSHPVYDFFLRRVQHIENLHAYAGRLQSLLSRHSVLPLDRWGLPSPAFKELQASLKRILSDASDLKDELTNSLSQLVESMLRSDSDKTHIPPLNRMGAISFIQQSTQIDELIRRLRVETEIIADCFEQRGLLREPNYHGSSDSYVVGPIENHKLLRAVDAILFYFSDRLIKDRPESPLPIAVTQGAGPYTLRSVSARLTVAIMPHADLFTPWFWPILGHELAHVVVDELDASSADNAEVPPSERMRLAREARNRLIQHLTDSMAEYISDPMLLDILPTAWADELICDVITTTLLGPAYAMAMAAMFGTDDLIASEKPPIHQLTGLNGLFLAFGNHPPTIFRLEIQYQTLLQLGYKRSIAHRLGLGQMIEATKGCLSSLGHNDTLVILDHLGRRAQPTAAIAFEVAKHLIAQDDWCTHARTQHCLDDVLEEERLNSDDLARLPVLLLNALWLSRAEDSRRIQEYSRANGIDPVACWRALRDGSWDAAAGMGAVVLALNRHLDRRAEFAHGSGSHFYQVSG